MDNYLKRTFLYVAFAILCGIVGAMLSQCVRKHIKQNEYNVIESVIHDTLYKDIPIAVVDTFIKYVYVKVPVTTQNTKEPHIPLNPKIEREQSNDTTRIGTDSIEIVIPITQKEYADTNYRAWVSGFMPSLDSLRIYTRTTERLVTPKHSRLHLTLGVGAALNRRVEPAVFVGVGWSFYEIKL